jgi:hypothetical protein
MSDFLVAYFHTQGEALASARKLLAYGLRSERVSIRIPGRPSTTLDDDVAHREIEDASRDNTPDEPAQSASTDAGTMVSVALRGWAFIVVDVCLMLKEAGAYLIDVTEQNAIQEYSDT